jgi:hypothetical protein
MGRNNKDFSKDMPGFEGTSAAFGNLIKSGQSIVEKRKPVKHEPDMDMPDYADHYEERNT